MTTMTERTPADDGTPVEERPLGDLGRRIAARRARLGLNRQETADRAGMALSYLSHLEEHPGAAPQRGVLGRLAAALETTTTELTGGTADLPPGREQAARTPQFTELDADECRALLGTHGVGRIAVPADEGPLVVPVNYGVVDGAIVFRTAVGATPSLAAGHRVAFEVDRVDDALSSGWSVLVLGNAQTVTDPAETRRLDGQVHSRPWAGGGRDLWMRVAADTVTGRRIRV
ncbi:pyridoxamine 5'-phosphate oxidase family protein [Streptomyces sp. NPDC088387]|uniref:pyridoxamine 5'-phosphate oxidase family protein n=1 Tax=Streptomyces sp. NPDC088387 TaxID=3365859 RepID=UPI0038091F47